ncbi:MAG: elongation factor 1-beta [Nanoarchaeota archaeon]|nr:elongation factor 1-beta [Nanoarchaeota archaeon]
MALALIKVKIMPDSPQADLSEIEKNAQELLKRAECKIIKFEQEPIAFGLIAVIVMFSWDDTISNDEVVESLQRIKHVSSAEVIDYRRAIG